MASNNNHLIFLRTTLSRTGSPDSTDLIKWRKYCKYFMLSGAGGKYASLIPYINDLNHGIDKPPKRPKPEEVGGMDEGKINQIYISLMGEHMKQKVLRATSRHALFAIMHGQTGGALRSALEAQSEFQASQTSGDIVWLWKTIEDLASGAHIGQNWLSDVAREQLVRVVMVRQGRNETLEEYHHCFTVEVEGISTAGVNYGGHSMLEGMDGPDELFADPSQADEAIIVSAWLHGLRNKYREYLAALRNNYLLNGGSVYPRNLGDAMQGVLTFVNTRAEGRDEAREGVTFNQGANEGNNQASSDWLVFDTGSTINTTAHSDSLLNVRHCIEAGLKPLRMGTNAGSATSEFVGELRDLEVESWLFEESRASVVSASQLKKLGCRIELKGDVDVFVVTFPSGKVFWFQYDPVSELYVYQLGSNNNTTNFTLLATVKDNKQQSTPAKLRLQNTPKIYNVNYAIPHNVNSRIFYIVNL